MTAALQTSSLLKEIKETMDSKIQLTHPAGKKAIRMSIEKYEMIKSALISCLDKKRSLTHKEMLTAITDYFQKHHLNFDGSIEWHMEWVKLDLEAKKKITRLDQTSPAQYQLT